MLNWIAWNGTVFLLQNWTYSKLNCYITVLIKINKNGFGVK